ncbi:MAG: tRNA (adenosine(37)-N6)-threonylcarbamoyltransferase complex transferase subunit TsaD [Aquificae bacterium]|nr:tRNA (adenosine(37)-N6)-threonylcarbamoyltransferase complex transferase subunit TsaD [Aquificota bacterium]
MALGLAVETSCDETAVALFDTKKGLVKDLVASQVSLHAPFGGVVPELSAREHVKNLTPLLEELFRDTPYGFEDLDFVAVTVTPGLLLSLVVGVAAAKAVAHYLNLPLVPVHHLEGHVYSVFLNRPVEHPFLALVVSGGHTELYLVEEFGRYRLLGSTLDDAVGEAFDKVARLLGGSYPGGPFVDSLARKGRPTVNFPLPKVKGEFNFSFSGLKTAVLHFLRKNPDYPKEDVAASFQKTVAEILISKTVRAVERFGVKRLAVVGGVAANSELRRRFSELQREGVEVLLPEPRYAGDNAAMIGLVGAMRYERGKFAPLDLNAWPNYPLEKFGREWT